VQNFDSALRANWPDVKIIAAEPEAVDDCAVSKKAGKLVVTEKSDTVCDGVRTNVGKNTWPLIQKLVDDVSLVLSFQISIL
jgi:serine racemase